MTRHNLKFLAKLSFLEQNVEAKFEIVAGYMSNLTFIMKESYARRSASRAVSKSHRILWYGKVCFLYGKLGHEASKCLKSSNCGRFHQTVENAIKVRRLADPSQKLSL